MSTGKCAQIRDFSLLDFCSNCLLTNCVRSGIMENSARQDRQRAAEFVQNDEKPHPKMRFPARKQRKREEIERYWDGVDWLSPSKALLFLVVSEFNPNSAIIAEVVPHGIFSFPLGLSLLQHRGARLSTPL